MARKALGRGLTALLGNDNFNSEKDELAEIGIDLIEPNSEQPRTRFEDEKLDELAQSIKANGIIQPVIVRKKGKKYQLIAGERRWRAAQKAGLQNLPAVIRNTTDEKLLELAIIENIQRQELNAIEEAKGYKNLIDKVGLTQEVVADRVGKNRTVITTYLRLLKLPKRIQKYIEEDKISAGHGRALLMSDDETVQNRIAQLIVEMGLSVRETEKAIKRSRSEKPQTIENKRVKPKLDANVKAAETKLMRFLGTNVQILPDGKGTGGKIDIEYYGTEDLNRIFDKILKEK